MNRTSRIASTVAVAALSLGVAGPAVAGGEHGRGDSGETTHGHHGSAHDDSAKDVKQVQRDIARLDKRLAAVAKESRLKNLSEDDRAAVLLNVSADRDHLSSLSSDVQAEDSALDLKQVRRDLKTVRPANYVEAINFLRYAARLTTKIEALRPAYAEGTNEATTLDAAAGFVAQAVNDAHGIYADSPTASLRGVRSALVQASVNVEAVEDSTDDPTDPTVPTVPEAGA